jgi:hypothetical protein
MSLFRQFAIIINFYHFKDELLHNALVNGTGAACDQKTSKFFVSHQEKSMAGHLGTAVGILTQLLGSWNHLVAYLSKQHDAVSPGWPPCLCTLAATAILVAEADNLTLGRKLTVQVPHSVLTLMEYKGNYWLTNSRMARYQSILCENPHV